jgi:spore coat protein U-like protein
MSQSYVYIKLGAAALAAMLFAAQPAMAATNTANVAVTAEVRANCIMTSTPLAFGTVDPLSSTPVTATGGVSVRCTNGTAYTLSGFGTGTRNLLNGTKQLPYTMYRESTYSTVFADPGVSRTGTGSYVNIPIYGRITTANLTTAEALDYADTVIVTVTY